VARPAAAVVPRAVNLDGVDPEEVENHLRAASDAIMLLLGEVEQLESHKRGVNPGNDRFAELARAVRDSSQALAELARDQEMWGQQAPLSDFEVATIAESQSAPPLPAILERWRDIERRLSEAAPGTAESAELFDEFKRVRDEYMAAFRRRESDS
jgi:hypothetical protein